jgi:hypothetical protein
LQAAAVEVAEQEAQVAVVQAQVTEEITALFLLTLLQIKAAAVVVVALELADLLALTVVQVG